MNHGTYANVIIDISHEKVDRPFQYRIPDSLKEKLAVGMCVQIPFGTGNRKRKGYVIEITGKNEYPEEKIKEIEEYQTELARTRNGLDDTRLKNEQIIKKRTICGRKFTEED